MIDARAAATFLASNTKLVTTRHVPEVKLHLATEPFGIFQAAEKVGFAKPFWSFAWPGGQALARWLLDHANLVEGRRVLDIGAGSGLTSIAALQAGAISAHANDTDPLAAVVARVNADVNGVTLETSDHDLLAESIDADVVLIGEVFYEPEMAMRITAFLERMQRQPATILFADRSGVRRPPLDLTLLAEIEAHLTPGLDIPGMDKARVWQVQPRRRGARRGLARAERA